jgi:large subunit ribosomal protein L13
LRPSGEIWRIPARTAIDGRDAGDRRMTIPSADHETVERAACSTAPMSLIGTYWLLHDAVEPGLDTPQKHTYDLGLPLPGRARLVFVEFGQPSGPIPYIGFSKEKAFSGMSTFMASADSAAKSGRWHIIDADGQVLGRVATLAARLLQGKHKAIYTPFIDTGDHVVVVNATKVKLTGRKEDQKIYRQHSGYEGGLREERARVVRAKKPERLVEETVHGMLPKTKLGAAMYRKLKVYAGPDHPHAAQKPSKLEVA